MANYKLKYAGEKIDELLTKIDNLGAGTDAKSGTVKLSSATDSDSGVSDGVAATPAAVKAAKDAVDDVNTDLETVKQNVANITPDDSTIGGKPWSSKNIVDMLCPPIEESGNPVVCYPVAGYPLGVKAKWKPVQEGTGTPSPENIRPIHGRDSVTITRQENNQVITLTLPETVYGGEVDAVNGEGIKNFERVAFDGTEEWGYDTKRGLFVLYGLHEKAKGGVVSLCDRYTGKYEATSEALYTEDNIFVIGTSVCGYTTASEWKAYLAAQYAAGTPVQVAYKLAKPVPFTATGAQPLPALAGLNTVMTDADSATVTGRADPIKRITDLEDAVASQT